MMRTCMHARRHGRRRLVVLTAGKDIIAQEKHACKHDDSGKQTVYAVQFSASLPYMRTFENTWQHNIQICKDCTTVPLDARAEPGCRHIVV